MNRAERIKTIRVRNIDSIMLGMRQQLRRMLSKRSGHFPEVIAETGLSREMINRLNNGRSKNPTLESVVRIAESCGYTLKFYELKDEDYEKKPAE